MICYAHAFVGVTSSSFPCSLVSFFDNNEDGNQAGVVLFALLDLKFGESVWLLSRENLVVTLWDFLIVPSRDHFWRLSTGLSRPSRARAGGNRFVQLHPVVEQSFCGLAALSQPPKFVLAPTVKHRQLNL